MLTVQSLPPAYREVVVLCELQELAYEAAASVLQCPVGTVRSRLHRARAMLASRLAALYGEEERRLTSTRDQSLEVPVTQKRCMA